MKLISSLSLLAAALLVAGCSDSNNPTSPGGSTNTADSYWPTSKGSTWTYAGSVNSTVTVGNDTTIDGKQYTIMNNVPGGASFIRRDGASYYSLEGSGAQEMLFLKDGAIGTSWTFDLTKQGALNHYTYTVTELGQTHVVNGKSYSNVMRVHLTDSVSFAGQTFMGTEADYYYAKGIGLIQADLGTLGVMNLVSYTIK